MNDLPYLDAIHEYIPVPNIFHSFLNEGLFKNCLVCNKFLLEDGIQYIVERAFIRQEPIYEFAICGDCQQNLLDELSKESQVRIDLLFDDRVDFVERRQGLLKQSIEKVDPWIDQCILSRIRRDACDTYTIYGHCDGGDLLFSYLPYMISGKAMGEIATLLSKKTKDRIDDFTEEFLGFPPELRGDPATPQLVIV